MAEPFCALLLNISHNLWQNQYALYSRYSLPLTLEPPSLQVPHKHWREG